MTLAAAASTSGAITTSAKSFAISAAVASSSG